MSSLRRSWRCVRLSEAWGVTWCLSPTHLGTMLFILRICVNNGFTALNGSSSRVFVFGVYFLSQLVVSVRSGCDLQLRRNRSGGSFKRFLQVALDGGYRGHRHDEGVSNDVPWGTKGLPARGSCTMSVRASTVSAVAHRTKRQSGDWYLRHRGTQQNFWSSTPAVLRVVSTTSTSDSARSTPQNLPLAPIDSTSTLHVQGSKSISLKVCSALHLVWSLHLYLGHAGHDGDTCYHDLRDDLCTRQVCCGFAN